MGARRRHVRIFRLWDLGFLGVPISPVYGDMRIIISTCARSRTHKTIDGTAHFGGKGGSTTMIPILTFPVERTFPGGLIVL